ncbi:MAG: MFS transporter, partial [Acidobacteriota bacterium]
MMLTVGHFSVDFYAGFIPVLVPVLQRAIGFTLTEAAILVSAFSLSASFSQTLFGVLFDRWHSVRLVALAPMLAAVTLSCLGIMPTYISLIFLVIAGGLSIAAFHPYGASLAALESGP